MGDMGDMYRTMKDDKKERRRKHGADCPECNIKQPKRIPTILLPGRKCKVCGYRRPKTDGQKLVEFCDRIMGNNLI